MSNTQYGPQELLVYPVYTCLVNQVNPSEKAKEQPQPPYNLMEMEVEEIDIETESEHAAENIERSKAEYKIDVLSSTENENETEHVLEHSCNEDHERSSLNNVELSFLLHDNRNILKLTRMKWLTENENSDKISSSSDTHTHSKINMECKEIVPMAHKKKLICDKHLSTILKLDKEHNLFGLANITISDISSNTNTGDTDEPLFPQSTIVLTCCGMGCCRHRSKSDLPVSLKCGTCGGCGGCPSCPPRPGCPICPPKRPRCQTCGGPCKKPAIHPPPCPTRPPSCPAPSCPAPSCPAPTLKPGVPPCSKPVMLPCAPLSCGTKCCYPDCATCRGFKMVLNKKPKYEPSPVEIASRAPSILHKPYAARKCSHTPRCQPPSSCFPYLMPCYWPALESAPCSHPERCFHNPGCPPPRRNECENTRTCPSPKCAGAAKCPNPSCPSKNPEAQKMYGFEMEISHSKTSKAAAPKKEAKKKGK